MNKVLFIGLSCVCAMEDVTLFQLLSKWSECMCVTVFSVVRLRAKSRSSFILGASPDTKTRKNPLGKSGTYSPTLANAPGLLEAKRLTNEARVINNGHQGKI